jgi:hypothetical protein
MHSFAGLTAIRKRCSVCVALCWAMCVVDCVCARGQFLPGAKRCDDIVDFLKAVKRCVFA